MKGRNPTAKEKKHMDKVSQLGCIVCLKHGLGYNPCEIHHINGKTKPNAHFEVIGLCFEHHRKGGDKEPISRHPYKNRFIAAYGTEEELMMLVLNELQYVKDNEPVDFDNLPF
jgi:hypothetical protein|tara:strand:+ start:1863 stop:2201 length:339 start_codon:yes stop_codon:yes gene_type:complete